MMKSINDILTHYASLLDEVDQWFNRSQAAYPDQIRCGQGCSGCCRSLFDVTLLDAWQVRRGYEHLATAQQAMIRSRAEARLATMRRHWPELAAPFILNYRPEAEWELLMPEEDETPCVFLENGRCLIYAHRPMTCRLHGLPLVDTSGEVLHDEWCTENFLNVNPLHMSHLRAPFDDQFRSEVALMRRLTEQLFEHQLGELDTFIPLAVLVDYDRFDWREWWERVVLVENPLVM